MKFRFYVGLAAMALAAGACAGFPEAQMQLPDNLQVSAETVTISGIGGGQRGSYAAGPYSGSFARSETRLAFFDPMVELRGGTTKFNLQGGELEGVIDAKCTMRERAITIGDISFKPKKMAYGCDFLHEGRSFPARFELQEISEGLGGMLSKRERRGEIAMDRSVIQIRSSHRMVGSAFDSASPIGYVFEAHGVPVGAVDINGAPVLTMNASTDLAARRAMLVSALALSIFWEPANSDM